jgi:sec-independent protein translocase protein TatA
MGFGTGEIIIVALVVVLVFGATKLPQLGDGLGRAIRNFKRAIHSANEIDVTPQKDELPENPGKSEKK